MSLLDVLTQQLGGDAIGQISRQVGADTDATSKAISGALPLLVAALAKNTADTGGAQALAGALDRDHDGSILDDLGGFLGGGAAAAGGDGILEHILGTRRQGAEAAIGQMSGLDGQKIAQIMAMLAPIVMGALGRQQRQGGMKPDQIGEMLGGERRRVEKMDPGAMGMLGSLLDADGDGDVKDDLARIGMGMLGKMFGGRR